MRGEGGMEGERARKEGKGRKTIRYCTAVQVRIQNSKDSQREVTGSNFLVVVVVVEVVVLLPLRTDGEEGYSASTWETATVTVTLHKYYERARAGLLPHARWLKTKIGYTSSLIYGQTRREATLAKYSAGGWRRSFAPRLHQKTKERKNGKNDIQREGRAGGGGRGGAMIRTRRRRRRRQARICTVFSSSSNKKQRETVLETKRRRGRKPKPTCRFLPRPPTHRHRPLHPLHVSRRAEPRRRRRHHPGYLRRRLAA